jgi:DNA-binding CsgD family transcriptional regulator
MDSSLIESLTWREAEILLLLDARVSDEEIAAALQRSSEAFRGDRSRVFRKSGLRLLPSHGPENAPPP